MSHSRRALESKFQTWLNQEVYVSSGVQQLARREAIAEFTADLRAFAESKGYAFRETEQRMANDWARSLFQFQLGALKNRRLSENPDGRPEDYDMFCYIFDYETWEPFLLAWQDGDDFIRNPYGQEALDAVYAFLWYHIDINASSVTKTIDDMLELSDSEGDENRARRIVDPYLVDQNSSVSKYNRWD